MALHDFECRKGHRFEADVPWDIDETKCVAKGCRCSAERVWTARGRGMLTNPIVVFRLSDGSYSFPGRSDAPTPPGAERREMRSMTEYNREMGRVNSHFRSKDERARELEHQSNERTHADFRADVVSEMNQTDNEMAKALYREALSRYSTDTPRPRRADIYSEAMEFDASNRDEWWSKGETGVRGRK